VSAMVELQMLKGSEFQTVGAATLKPREDRGRQRWRGHVEPTADVCWQNAEKVWECDN